MVNDRVISSLEKELTHDELDLKMIIFWMIVMKEKILNQSIIDKIWCKFLTKFWVDNNIIYK